MNKELARTLTVALVNYLDENRPEGTMDCSSGECVSLEKSFVKENFDSVETLVNKKLSRLTEFELRLLDWLSSDTSGEIPMESMKEVVKNRAEELLAIAKKELARRDEVITLTNLPPYDKGFQDGKAEAMTELERTFECNQDKLPIWLKNELAKKHLEGYIMGREDTMREMRDFIESHFNCENAKKGTPIVYNTQSGTSTLKAEDNASATDGKEHNPSFTD